jgi:hypothetical protein
MPRQLRTSLRFARFLVDSPVQHVDPNTIDHSRTMNKRRTMAPWLHQLWCACRSPNQSRVPSPRCRDSGPYFLPKRTLRTCSNRQPPSPKPARFAHTCDPRVSWCAVYCDVRVHSFVGGGVTSKDCKNVWRPRSITSRQISSDQT